MFKRTKGEALGQPDWILFFTTIAIAILGLMMVYSSTTDLSYRLWADASRLFKRQALWLLVGFVLMVIAMRVPYHHWTKFSILLMAVTLVLLVISALLGQRLLIGQSVSPVELAKLAVVVYIGHWLSSKSEVLTRLPYGLLPFTIMVGVIVGLVMSQKPADLSEAMVIVIVAMVMFFMAGADILQFAIGLAGGSAAFAFVVSKMPHALPRLESYWAEMQDPLHSGSLQLVQGLVALGSGGLLGVGAGNGRAKYQWLPAAHTDSIFAVIGEELGLVGCLLLVGLFVLLAYRGLRTAALVQDTFGRLMALGVTTWITFQALVNMAVVTGTIPYTGITLPFISVGGSSLVACMVGIGIVLSISRTVNLEGATSHEARRVRGRDGGTRISRPDRRQSPA